MNIWTDCKKLPLPDSLSFIVDNRGKTVPLTDGGSHKLIATNCVRNENLYPSYEKVRFLSQETYDNWFRAHPVPEDILFVCKGTPGRVCYVPNPVDFCIAQDMVALRSNPEIVYSRYLLAILRSRNIQEQITNTSVGDVIPHFKKQFFDQLMIPIPPIEVQKQIGDSYFAFSLKIEHNKLINENLSQQAQAIFANMFTDNDSITPATIADVALNVTDGVHNTVHDDPEGQYLLLSCKNIKGGSLSIGNSERRISKDTFEKLRRRTKLEKGDVLISSVGTVGELLLLNTEPSFYEFQRSVAIVKPNPTIVSPAFLYESLVSQKAELVNAAHGAVQQCLFISDIAGFPIGIPDSKDLKKFDEIVIPMFDEISANEAESIRLAALRDTLLPKLMSGELDVSELDL